MNPITNDTNILQALPVGVLIVDGDGNVQSINPAAVLLLGLIEDGVGQYESGVSKPEFIALLDSSCQDDWSRLFDTIDEEPGNDQWCSIASIKGPMPVNVTPWRGDEGLTSHIVILLDPIKESSVAAPRKHDRALVHEMNNCLAVATTNAELIKINIDRGELSRLATSARLISDNLFRLAELLQQSTESTPSR